MKKSHSLIPHLAIAALVAVSSVGVMTSAGSYSGQLSSDGMYRTAPAMEHPTFQEMDGKDGMRPPMMNGEGMFKPMEGGDRTMYPMFRPMEGGARSAPMRGENISPDGAFPGGTRGTNEKRPQQDEGSRMSESRMPRENTGEKRMEKPFQPEFKKYEEHRTESKSSDDYQATESISSPKGGEYGGPTKKPEGQWQLQPPRRPGTGTYDQEKQGSSEQGGITRPADDSGWMRPPMNPGKFFGTDAGQKEGTATSEGGKEMFKGPMMNEGQDMRQAPHGGMSTEQAEKKIAALEKRLSTLETKAEAKQAQKQKSFEKKMAILEKALAAAEDDAEAGEVDMAISYLKKKFEKDALRAELMLEDQKEALEEQLANLQEQLEMMQEDAE